MKIIVQMDPIESINIDSDTSFELMIRAQELGHEIFYYKANDLFFDGEVKALIHKIELFRSEDYYKILKSEVLSLDEFDILLMRQDPPFDMQYLTYTYLLEKSNVRVINNPKSVRDCPEKIYATFFDYMPKTIITRNTDLFEDFINEGVIIKPLYGHGGNDIKYTKSISETNLLIDKYNCPVMLQEYIAEVTKGDKRVFIINGKIEGTILRVPEQGSILSNMVQGAKAFKTELTVKEQIICEEIAKDLIKRDILIAGIDLINEKLTEINITSPTGLVTINKLYNKDLAKTFWDKITK